MKTKIFKGLVVILAVLLFSAAFVGCNALSDKEKKVVGKYHLIELEASKPYSHLTVDSYAYYTLDFKSDRKCIVSYKNSVEPYYATATWKMNKEGKIEVVTRIGRSKATEIFVFDGTDHLSGKNTYAVDADNTFEMRTVFKKVIEQ